MNAPNGTRRVAEWTFKILAILVIPGLLFVASLNTRTTVIEETSFTVTDAVVMKQSIEDRIERRLQRLEAKIDRLLERE